MKADEAMASQEPFKSTSILPGLRCEEVPGAIAIRLEVTDCGWAGGRLLVLLSALLGFFVGALFFWEVTALPGGDRVSSGIFATVFSGCFLLLLCICIVSFGPEMLVITNEEFVLMKQVGPFTRKKRIEKESLLAVALGQVSTGEDVNSPETVSLICLKNKRGKAWNCYAFGYLLDARYRKALYELLLKVIEKEVR